jgi:hypothetical protein
MLVHMLLTVSLIEAVRLELVIPQCDGEGVLYLCVISMNFLPINHYGTGIA